MTAIVPGLGHSLMDYSMPGDASEHMWGHHQSTYMLLPTLTNGWSHSQGSEMGGMQDGDHPAFHSLQRLDEIYGSPVYGNLQSDVDMATPSSAGFPAIMPNSHPVVTPNSGNKYLNAPTDQGNGSVSSQSPRSTHGQVGTRRHRNSAGAQSSLKPPRPPFGRSSTAPQAGESAAFIKRSPASDGDDEDYIPHEGGKGRGRKRQRIPHTAVERRYRENLNAHLDRLREAVPALVARSKGGDPCHEGVKPSKCEILNGAIEHIGALSKENQALRSEIMLLKARYNDIAGFYQDDS
ncbi:hypothetical protein BAUCODRAFT_470611 [Baudoinia panamericana UAMH 10762]|uniref:BHLH domain-containing protein n=1 Tax=Baudoinia panamericana (strain UAMH 10762) TaxID=717646 RepID=M2MI46_BAUPA|nr:uncharacterized protein BAUCODRAFT_470611 [Baudoinia panamericana UAMH 10762]EMC96331.1 hypothetical protein BAUCODRAFT_470611 [Baudoinia panamericana UAMH 10762]